MATYYRWAQNTVSYNQISGSAYPSLEIDTNKSILDGLDWFFGDTYSIDYSTGKYILPMSGALPLNVPVEVNYKYMLFDIPDFPWMINNNGKRRLSVTHRGDAKLIIASVPPTLEINFYLTRIEATIGTFVSYVYSTDASTYPTDGVSGSYWYNDRTLITSPTNPSGLAYPSIINTPTVAVSWSASISNVPSYQVSLYEISYSTNGGSTWTGTTTTTSTSTSVMVPSGATSLQIRVRAQDTNGQWSTYTVGTNSTVLLSPTITVPSIAMQGQQITVNWTAITGATSYTLQRKADTDDNWVQVYSGADLTFTETVGTWTTVQYQVQAVYSSGAGGWATSSSIPVISASALVISGTDGDLGTLTADVPYTISSDTGNPITLTRKVNGNLVATLLVQSGFAYTIPVMDLPTGSGTIEISATVNATSGGLVSATRTWTYAKTAIIFPDSASVGQLSQDGANIFPATLAEAVRVPTNWGGTLDKALELLYDAANSAVISVGTYDGTGTFGVDNPNTLTISPSPQVVTIYGGGQTLVISSTDTSSPAYISGTHVQWYSTVSAAEQMNANGVTYSYVAVAKGVSS